MFFTIFLSVFLAELGDKTQLATLLFATQESVSKLYVFFAASLALVCSTGVAVLLGDLIAKYINAIYLNKIAALGFIVIGIWMLFKS